MEDSSTIIALLTINIILLTIVVAAFLAAAVILIVRINRTVKHMEDIAENISSISEWFVPSRIFSSVLDLFKK